MQISGWYCNGLVRLARGKGGDLHLLSYNLMDVSVCLFGRVSSPYFRDKYELLAANSLKPRLICRVIKQRRLPKSAVCRRWVKCVGVIEMPSWELQRRKWKFDYLQAVKQQTHQLWQNHSVPQTACYSKCLYGWVIFVFLKFHTHITLCTILSSIIPE